MITLLTEMASDAVLDRAYAWLCKRRLHYPPDADIWTLRFRWPQEKATIRTQLLAGSYRFEPLSRIRRSNGDDLELWSARDALVLKAMSDVLGRHLPVSIHCTHVKGHGGAKGAVREVCRHLPDNSFVLRTDVKSYYASIDHVRLLDQLAEFIEERAVLHLLWQYLRRTVTWGGLYWEHTRSISRGCPLIGAFHLRCLDEAMAQHGLFYVRFMDDILVLAPTRWKLRRAVRSLNEVFAVLGLEQHPDKTFIGRIERGFDFLGYHFGAGSLTLAHGTIRQFAARAARLYEQEQGEPDGFSPFGRYVRRRIGWAKGGLGEWTLEVAMGFLAPLPPCTSAPGFRRIRCTLRCCGGITRPSGRLP